MVMGDDVSPGSGDVDVLTTTLIEEFRTRLDDTLVIAILSDFDLTQQYDEAHAILEGLAQNVTAEEASVFHEAGLEPTDETTSSRNAAGLSGVEWHDTTGASHATTDSAWLHSETSSNIDWSHCLSEQFESLDLPKDVDVAALDEDGKVAELKLMFAELNEVDLKLTLKKVKGDFTKACEELLNLQFLEENDRQAKEKDKGKNRLDVDYRLAPIDLSEREDASNVGPTKSSRLVRRNSLPRIITSQNVGEKNPISAPISPVIKPTDWQTVRPKKKTYNELATEAAASRAFANQTMEAAYSAYRRGKSDALYRPVAGVLAEQAKERRARARLLEQEQHEAFVDRTASADSIDLHGVPVADGVQIALDRTQSWWVALGENRVKKAREQGFVVVTGLGIHSSSGVSRLRQEVGAALKREGWRVRVETGQFVVTGKT
ncbi:hypothetical protein N0V93_002328 [Gnomoniopsis smithogilvyi]|uniref:Smr domain-containing protein n=1 Tax=Gnomoniopsis smithogilvyi TaxID=1191159 RepID=A0A9W8YWI3_9PEZI|nr:hypothetical protein N0V93_002328 [Gnomoniopsis smithogilvyi]